MDVRYARDGKPASARINLNDSSDVYHKGDRVTVVYDPAHPDRARTIREDGQSQGSVLIMPVLTRCRRISSDRGYLQSDPRQTTAAKRRSRHLIAADTRTSVEGAGSPLACIFRDLALVARRCG
jgi:Protein of unknown function (DUF3592)